MSYPWSRAFGRGLTPKRLESNPLVLLLSNVCPARSFEADQWTMTASATERMAEMLNIKAGDQCWVIQRVFYDRCGAPSSLQPTPFRGAAFRQLCACTGRPGIDSAASPELREAAPAL